MGRPASHTYLARFRLKARLRSCDIAAALGITRGYCSALLSGRLALSAEMIAQLVELYPDLDEDVLTLSSGRLPGWAAQLARRHPEDVEQVLMDLEDEKRQGGA